jgi:hypothetical protein
MARPAESHLLDFYRGIGTDAAGRTIAVIWSWDHRRLEMVHDFIQWLFPLPDPSRFNPDAPLLTQTDIAAFRADTDLQDRVRRSLDLMLSFLGLKRDGPGIARMAAFTDKAHWLEPTNHNHLRLTRIMLFLGHAGLKAEAANLLACLEDIAAKEGAGLILPRTLDFWRAAVPRA